MITLGAIPMRLVDALKILELSFDADVHLIKASYKRLALQMHPDQQGSVDDFTELNAAYKLAMAWAMNAPCPHCDHGKVLLVRGVNTLKIPCTFCHGTGKRG